MSLDSLFSRLKGGAGSGNIGHAGRPGHHGGSAPKGGSVLTKIDALPQLENFPEGQVKAPFEFESFGEFRDKTRNMKKGTPYRAKVNILELKTMQEEVDRDKLKSLAKDRSEGELPLVMTDGKTFLIRDGTHRLTILKLAGAKEVEVDLVEYK